MGAQWLSVRVLDTRPRGRGFESYWRHCVVSLCKNINPSLVLVQSRKTRPYITERLLIGCKESNQTKQCLYWNYEEMEKERQNEKIKEESIRIERKKKANKLSITKTITHKLTNISKSF